MGLASKIPNGKSGAIYTVSTIHKHTNDYYVKEMGYKVSLSIQSRVHDGSAFHRKKSVTYISWCGDGLSLEEFHHKVCYLITVADTDDIAEFVYRRLNDEIPYSAFYTNLLLRRKTKAIIVD